MTVAKLNLRGKNVVVGIRLDQQAKELLDWAVFNVAGYGDNVVAIHVCRNSDYVLEEKLLLDSYLEDYHSYCHKKQVVLIAEVLYGNSVKEILVREANKYAASAVIIGINKRKNQRYDSIAGYCAERLPQSTEVMAVYNGNISFCRSSMNLLTETRVAFKEFETVERSRLSYDGRKGSKISVRRQTKSSLCSIPIPAEDFPNQSPGWPLFQTAESFAQPELEARKLSVVQWVMTLPERSLSEVDKSEKKSFRDEIDFQNTPLRNEMNLILEKNSSCCKVFSHDFCKLCTSEFSPGNLIAKGGCSSVYKGILPDGKLVAVKVAKSSREAWTNFVNEIDIMTTLKHRSITPLLGICVQNNKSLISVYEFFSKGNLEENLQGTMLERTVLSWERRFKIAVGIAEALNYMHNLCLRPVIHRDIKSSNILVTDGFEPQLCDFDLAIWGPRSPSSVLTYDDVVGTFGYIAPEYFMHGRVSDKIDVYAFGVVLLELISGKKPIGLGAMENRESLVMWAKPKLESGNAKSIIDPYLAGEFDKVQMHRMCVAAKCCLIQAARLRPNMNKILKILTGEDNLEEVESVLDDSNNDDEVYQDSSIESHLSLAFLDVNEESDSIISGDDLSSHSSLDVLKKWSQSKTLEQLLKVGMKEGNSPFDDLKKTWNRSPSLEQLFKIKD